MKENRGPSLYELARMFFYIGAVGYGGPAILAQIDKKIADERKWITKKDFLDALSLAQILPGSTGVSVVTSIGYRTRGIMGVLVSVAAFLFPATAAMVAITWAYFMFGNLHFVQSLMTGLGALVVALLVSATLKLGKTVFKKIDLKDIKGFFIAAIAFIGIFFFNINVVFTIVLAALLGFASYYFTDELEDERLPERNGNIVSFSEGSVRWRRGDYWAIALAAVPFVIIMAIPLWRQIFGIFFSIGVLAFGGGFTAVPLIQHQVVDSLHWVNLAQFRDGIALGQVTPGPVLITATFIGYKLAWIWGALVGTLAVFGPMPIMTVALFNIHAKLKEFKLVKAIIKGILSGFIGLLVAVTIQFGVKSLNDWQTWLIFFVSLGILLYLKKDVLWAIFGAALLSLILI